MNRVIDLLKKIGRSFRSNMGLKIVAFLFAILLWNYVVSEANPVWTQTYMNIKIQKIEGLTTLKNNGYTLVGDSSQYLKKANIRVELSRKDSLDLHASDLSAWLDVSNISKEGETALKVQSYTPKGQIVNVEPKEIKVKVEKLAQKVVPVECVKTGNLPADYWLAETVLSQPTLMIQGAASSVDKVIKAQVSMALDNLTQQVSVPRPFTLLDQAGKAVSANGIDFISAPNSIVTLQVYPTKTVPVDLQNVVSGSTAIGYEVTGVEASPAQVEIAGPKDVLDTIDRITLSRIALDGANGDFSVYRQLDLRDGLHPVSAKGVTVSVKVGLKMAQTTVTDLPVKFTGLGAGLSAQKVSASVVLTCPENEVKYARSHVRLYADVTGMGVGTRSVPLTVEFDPELGVTSYTIKPENILVTITAP